MNGTYLPIEFILWKKEYQGCCHYTKLSTPSFRIPAQRFHGTSLIWPFTTQLKKRPSTHTKTASSEKLCVLGNFEGWVGIGSTLCKAIHLLLLLRGKVVKDPAVRSTEASCLGEFGSVIFGEWELQMDAWFFVPSSVFCLRTTERHRQQGVFNWAHSASKYAAYRREAAKHSSKSSLNPGYRCRATKKRPQNICAPLISYLDATVTKRSPAIYSGDLSEEGKHTRRCTRCP